ncbi:F-box/kelch-repeat protein At3g06240-like [Diospyros lotus]|uniref:F-box/kelch-repeat protein At3g06240-like n=1 Tax=Diospyros lotus TaxID=55363 RepID=UPI002252A303|nr:F-box/kelch-repeat protein At3g06240-like [Diospyros lotus]
MNLPEDVLVEILSRCPVKSLVRFRAVCKSWHILVNNQSFVSTHLNQQLAASSGGRLLVSHRDNLTNKRLISFSADDNLDNFANQLDLPPFLNQNFSHVRLIGPCNGLVCLYGFPDNIALWNPATRDCKVLPMSWVPRPAMARVLGGDLAFGFDSKTGDYKVVQILFCSSNQLGVAYQVEIYTLRTDSWRKYEGTLPAHIMYLNVWSMIYRPETFCWWAKDSENTEIVLSFDMGDETFQKAALPSDAGDLGGELKNIRAIMPMNGALALVVYRLKEVEKVFDLWVLREVGVEAAWTRLSSIGPLLGVERPLGFWKNGEFILENSCGQLVLYEPRFQKIRNLGLQGKRDRLEVLVYRDSLVSLTNI